MRPFFVSRAASAGTLRGMLNVKAGNVKLVGCCVGVALACAASAGAASKITGAQIKNNSITSADIKNGSLTERDLKQRSFRSLQETPVSTVTAKQVQPTDSGTVGVQVDCPAGQVATGGGGQILAPNYPPTLRSSVPVITNGRPTGWSVQLFAKGGDTAEAYVICTPGA